MPAGHSSRSDTELDASASTLLSGRYRLDAVLGQGGVGTVWRARDLQLDRDVAVKQLQPGVASDPAAAERFRREATTAASLSHPSLATIYDVGEDGDVVYLVMELIDGPSVKDVLANGGPLEFGEVAALGVRVAEALSAVHARGLVHRDIKPGNVLLPVDGPPKLVDFGTVHVLGDTAATLTTPGTMLGTIGYVAPEQFEGHEVTPRADVYAVGLLLHECLTGEPTFGTGTIAELTRRRLVEDPEPASGRRPDVWPELDEIVSRAVLRDPAQRFADADALAAALMPLVPGDADGRLQALARQHRGAAQGRTTTTDPVAETVVAPAADDLEETTVLPRHDDAAATAATGSTADVEETTVLPRQADTADTPPAARPAPPVVPPGPSVPPGPPPGEDVGATSVLSPTGPVEDVEEPSSTPPRGLLPLVGLGLAAVVLAVLAIAAMNGTEEAGNGGGGNGGGGGGGAAPVAVAGGQDHDPFGDSEHPEDVPRAFDGDPGTEWQTQRYNSPTLDKPGVGMWVQAEEGARPRRVEIDLLNGGSDIALYALDSAPAADPAAWGDPVQTFSGANGTIKSELPEGTNVVLVWFTNLADDGGGHRDGITELRLFE